MEREFNNILAALSVVKESQRLQINLLVSIQSSSSARELVDEGLGNFLRTTRKKLYVRLIVCFFKMLCSKLSKIFLNTLQTRLSGIAKIFNLMN